MIISTENADCYSFRECERYANEYLKWLYRHSYDPAIYYEELACGPSYCVYANVNGSCLHLTFDYLETAQEFAPDLYYAVVMSVAGIEVSAIDKLNERYKKEFDNGIFTCVYRVDEDFNEEVVIGGGYPYFSDDVEQNMLELTREIKRKDGVVERIKKEVNRLQEVQKLTKTLSIIKAKGISKKITEDKK